MSIVNKSNEKSNSNSTKYIHFILIAAVFLGFMYFSAPAKTNNLRIYQFNGQNDFAALNNGLIISLGEQEQQKFLAGDLIFWDGVSTHITNVQVQLFFYDISGSRTNIFSSGVNFISSDYITFDIVNSHVYPLGALGSDSGSLWDEETLDKLITSLHCEVIVTYDNGKIYESILALEITDVLFP